MFETYAVPAAGAVHAIKNVCVYCGSSAGNDPAFVAAGRFLGTAMARAGLGLVYGGGGGDGLMGTIAQAALSAGGYVTAIIPSFLKEREEMLDGAQELIVVDDMHQRKLMMFERSDAFVALPGGIGTLEELVEQMTWRQLDRHSKPVVIADINGYWQPLLALISHMGETGFVRPGFASNYRVASCVTGILPALLGKAGPRRQTASMAMRDAMDEVENTFRRDVY
jgi:uncharacterized protein (TIGR00730 family)